MTEQLELRRPPTRAPRSLPAARRLVLHGDFDCPWSYLASRRAALLAAAGVGVDWRAVEHQPWRPGHLADSAVRLACAREEIDRVAAHLLPGERLPDALAGYLPHTGAAVAGYAEAYGVGVAPAVRELLFDALWVHGLDLDDAAVVRTLIGDAVACAATEGPLREWGYCVSVDRGPVTTVGWRLMTGWAAQWRAGGKRTVPVLVVDDEEPLYGVDAVDRLAEELLRRGLDPGAEPSPVATPALPGAAGPDAGPDPVPDLVPDPGRDLAPLSWVSQHGNRWLRAYRRARRGPLATGAC